MLLDLGSHDVEGEVGVLLGDAHRRLHPEDVAGEAALPDQQLHVFAVLPETNRNCYYSMYQGFTVDITLQKEPR